MAGDISRLLAHYWSANEDHRLRAALAEDWLGDLEEFGAERVADACTWWRRNHSKRPTIADLRQHCQPTADFSPPEHQAHISQKPPVDHQARYAAADAWRQQFAEERGLSSFAEVMQCGIRKIMKRPDA